MTDSATFNGIRNGRPRFDFGDGVPPKWLLALLEGGKADGEQFVLKGGKRLSAGDVVRP
jgi:hypothetical protein